MPNVSTLTTEDAVLLVQLTDSHLFAEADGSLLGLRTADSLRQVIALVRAEQPQVDLLLCTGDLAQDGSVMAYRHFRELTESLCARGRWIPGNHDNVPNMYKAAVQSSLLDPVVDLGNWRITLLQSNVVQKSYGYLEDSQLQLLAQSLSKAPDLYHLISLHHHPVQMGCEWMRPIELRNASEFWKVLDRHPQVRGVLWGHVHQEFDQHRNGVRLLASPSTCIQFTPASSDFKVSSDAPGYRWLRLQPYGTLQTGVSRIPDFFFEPDYSASNY